MARFNFCIIFRDLTEETSPIKHGHLFFRHINTNHRRKHEFSMLLELDGSGNLHPMESRKR